MEHSPTDMFPCTQLRKLYIVNYLNFLLRYSKDTSETRNERISSYHINQQCLKLSPDGEKITILCTSQHKFI